MSLLWATAALSSDQQEALEKVRALPGEPDRPNMVSGEPVKRLMAEHGIVVHASAPHIDAEIQPQYEGSASFYPHEELHTSQNHLWKPALENYIKHGHEHLCHPDYEHEDETSETEDDHHEHYHIPYRPQIYTHGDNDWIDEGHHRILASRMLGEHFEAEHGVTLEPDDGKWD